MKQSLINKMAGLCERNHHAEALILLAKALGEDAVKVRITEILEKHLDLGYLPENLKEERFGLYTRLMKKARAVLSESSYQKVYGAF